MNMQPLRDYLNESPLQYEGILDPNQDQVMNTMTDVMIRQRIREYCEGVLSKTCWEDSHPRMDITKVDKDKNGWYIETEASIVCINFHDESESFYEYCLSHDQKMDKQKGFLIEGTEIYFRWRKHHGEIVLEKALNLESTDGLPEELDVLSLWECCRRSKKFDVRCKMKFMDLTDLGDVKITGRGCKNVIIYPGGKVGNITVPNGVEIHHPINYSEYHILKKKILKL